LDDEIVMDWQSNSEALNGTEQGESGYYELELSAEESLMAYINVKKWSTAPCEDEWSIAGGPWTKDEYTAVEHTERVFGDLRRKIKTKEDAANLSLDQTLHEAVKLLICGLVSSHEEASRGFSVLVFCPTWRSLEKQHQQITHSGVVSPHNLHVLHSTTDIEVELRAIGSDNISGVKVILATNVAESSVTIPSVAHGMCIAPYS
jgi:hypothetical protein